MKKSKKKVEIDNSVYSVVKDVQNVDNVKKKKCFGVLE